MNAEINWVAHLQTNDNTGDGGFRVEAGGRERRGGGGGGGEGAWK